VRTVSGRARLGREHKSFIQTSEPRRARPEKVLTLARGGPFREIGILLPNNQRQHRTLHIQKDVLPYALCVPFIGPRCPHNNVGQVYEPKAARGS